MARCELVGKRLVRYWLAFVVAISLHGPALATTKGLSQIVTPDLQPAGQLSLSFQAQSKRIANPYQLQAELGLTSWLEGAVFQGLSPSEEIFGTLVGLVHKDPYLLTTGFINWSTRGERPQPFLEGGYFTEHDKFTAGPIEVHRRIEAMAGWAHDFNPTWRFQIDFQSSADNFSTIGFTCNVTDRFQFNPALYIANDHTHRVLGYLVLTYTLPVWNPQSNGSP
jgi:hypothetical protein